MIGFLIEHYAGKFPVWLAPEQARIIPITEAHHDYARQLEQRLRAAGIRAEADLGTDRMNAKIRQAQLMQTPYMLVVGDREMEQETVSLRRRDNTRQNDLPVGEFVATVQDKIMTRAGGL
jgi:threonyl-tRNA synthetase